jgi:ATP-dependent Clp protease protease subunit
MPQEEEKKPAVQDPQIQEKLLNPARFSFRRDHKESAEAVIKQQLILEG